MVSDAAVTASIHARLHEEYAAGETTLMEFIIHSPKATLTRDFNELEDPTLFKIGSSGKLTCSKWVETNFHYLLVLLSVQHLSHRNNKRYFF